MFQKYVLLCFAILLPTLSIAATDAGPADAPERERVDGRTFIQVIKDEFADINFQFDPTTPIQSQPVIRHLFKTFVYGNYYHPNRNQGALLSGQEADAILEHRLNHAVNPTQTEKTIEYMTRAPDIEPAYLEQWLLAKFCKNDPFGYYEKFIQDLVNRTHQGRYEGWVTITSDSVKSIHMKFKECIVQTLEPLRTVPSLQDRALAGHFFRFTSNELSTQACSVYSDSVYPIRLKVGRKALISSPLIQKQRKFLLSLGGSRVQYFKCNNLSAASPTYSLTQTPYPYTQQTDVHAPALPDFEYADVLLTGKELLRLLEISTSSQGQSPERIYLAD